MNDILFVNFSGTNALSDDHQIKVNSITVQCHENIDGMYTFNKNILSVNCSDDYEYTSKKILMTIKSILDIKEFSTIRNIYLYKDYMSEISIKTILESNVIKHNNYTGYAVNISVDRTSHKKFVSSKSKWHKKNYLGPVRPYCDINYGFSLSRKSMEVISNEYKISDIDTIHDTFINENVLIGNTLNKHKIGAVNNEINIYPIKQKRQKKIVNPTNKIKTYSYNKCTPNNLLGIDKIFYINLNHRTDRRRFMESYLNELGIPFERVEASQVKSIEELYDTKSKFNKIYQRCTLEATNFIRNKSCHKRIKAIIGTHHSHISLYEKISNLDGDRYLILEDDCKSIGPTLGMIKKDFDNGNIDTDWDLVRSVWDVNKPKKTTKFNGVHRLSRHNRDCVTHNICGGAHFTLINKKSAKKICEYLNNENVFAFDGALSTNKLNVYYNYYNIPHNHFHTDNPKVKNNSKLKNTDKLLFVRISCMKESSNWNKWLQTHPDQIIVCANPKLESNFTYDDRILTVKCYDNYESLPEKVVATYNALIECEPLKKYSHFIKIDSDVNILDILEYSNDNKIFINNYTGGIVHTLVARNWHFGKVSIDSPWHDKLYNGPVVPYAGGGKTYTLSRKSLKVISKTYNFDNLYEIRSKYILEDVMIGVLLHKHNIKPTKNDISLISHKLNVQDPSVKKPKLIYHT